MKTKTVYKVDRRLLTQERERTRSLTHQVARLERALPKQLEKSRDKIREEGRRAGFFEGSRRTLEDFWLRADLEVAVYLSQFLMTTPATTPKDPAVIAARNAIMARAAAFTDRIFHAKKRRRNSIRATLIGGAPCCSRPPPRKTDWGRRRASRRGRAAARLVGRAGHPRQPRAGPKSGRLRPNIGGAHVQGGSLARFLARRRAVGVPW